MEIEIKQQIEIQMEREEIIRKMELMEIQREREELIRKLQEREQKKIEVNNAKHIFKSNSSDDSIIQEISKAIGDSEATPIDAQMMSSQIINIAANWEHKQSVDLRDVLMKGNCGSAVEFRDGKREVMAGGGGPTSATMKERERRTIQRKVKSGDEEMMVGDEPWQVVAGDEKLQVAGVEMVGEWAEEAGGCKLRKKKVIDLGLVLDLDPFAIWAGLNEGWARLKEDTWATSLGLSLKFNCYLNPMEMWAKFGAVTVNPTNFSINSAPPNCRIIFCIKYAWILLVRRNKNWGRCDWKILIDDWVYHKTILFFTGSGSKENFAARTKVAAAC